MVNILETLASLAQNTCRLQVVIGKNTLLLYAWLPRFFAPPPARYLPKNLKIKSGEHKAYEGIRALQDNLG